MTLVALPCAPFVPDDWRQPVPGAPLPDLTAGGWAAFGDAQTGQLDKANDRTLATIHIIERCDKANADIRGKL